MKKEKMYRLLFALVASGLASFVTAGIYFQRDAIFSWDWVSSSGEFRIEENILRSKALQFFERKKMKQGQLCVDQWIGQDSEFIYMAVGCAKFEEKLGAVSVEGDENFFPIRFRYQENEVVDFDQPDRTAYENSLKRIFPKRAAQILAVKMNQDLFRQMGLEKTIEQISRAIPAPPSN